MKRRLPVTLAMFADPSFGAVFRRRAAVFSAVGLTFACGASAHAQISLSTAVDMALTHSAKVRLAEADLAKARASLQEAHDAYVPAINAGAGIGESYGYSPNPPTLFTFNAQSLVYNISQPHYVKAANIGIRAAHLSLEDARQAVAEDTALTFVALQHDEQREDVLHQENEMAERLVTIVEDRFNGGEDTAIDLTTARLTAAQYHLAGLRAEDDTAKDRDHLALLMGIAPTESLRADGQFPSMPAAALPAQGTSAPATPAVAAAYDTADAKQQTALGDTHFLYRPQLSLLLQYNRYATFTNSFKELQNLNSDVKIGPNEGVVAIEIQIPLFDKERQAKARASVADALHARAEADDAQMTALDGQLKLRHNIEVLRAQTEVAQLEQQLAQQQLDAVKAQLNSSYSNPSGPQMSPKDEQNSRLAEREKYLSYIDANFQLRQAQISLLRQTGQIESWLRQAATAPAPHP